MGSSFVDYRGNGFEANDSTLEVWLALLVDAIDQVADPPDWLVAARADWETQATAKFAFGVMPMLDHVVTDTARRDVILAIAARALARLKGLGDPIPAETLNAMDAHALRERRALPEIGIVRASGGRRRRRRESGLTRMARRSPRAAPSR